MKKLLLALSMCLMTGGIAAAQSQADPNPAGVILMTTGKCETIGEGWVPYAEMAGRFPLAAGHGTDDRGGSVTFELGEAEGEYEHQLTVSEMPVHDHDYIDEAGRVIRADYGDDEPSALRDRPRKTGSRGDGMPHNNMPPYLVVNFCHLPGDS